MMLGESFRCGRTVQGTGPRRLPELATVAKLPPVLPVTITLATGGGMRLICVVVPTRKSTL
jgi:hypothetical protein